MYSPASWVSRSYKKLQVEIAPGEISSKRATTRHSPALSVARSALHEGCACISAPGPTLRWCQTRDPVMDVSLGDPPRVDCSGQALASARDYSLFPLTLFLPYLGFPSGVT